MPPHACSDFEASDPETVATPTVWRLFPVDAELGWLELLANERKDAERAACEACQLRTPVYGNAEEPIGWARCSSCPHGD